jgi:deaminated glutathione amidase
MSFRAALVQMRSGVDEQRNLAAASALIREAAAGGAQFVSTPEMTNLFEPDRERLKAIARVEAEDEAMKAFSALAQAHRIWLHAGSFALMGDKGKLVNRSLLFSPEGKVAARYDKIHLFDVDLPNGDKYRESATYAGGQDAVVVDTPLARLGLTICYDMRFPLLYHALGKEGVGVIAAPAAFTRPTGEAHWHVLLRARAIETGSFVLAAAQGGKHDSGRETYGHSIIINPWGEVVGEAGIDPGLIMADIDLAEVAAARARIPAIANARPFVLKRA